MMTDTPTPAPGDLRVPKSMDADLVVWAFRDGVITGMRSRGAVIPRQGHGYVQAPSRVLRLSDRVRREWMRRHPGAYPLVGREVL